jgi:glycosyltransferase involved in cell wall biosynthesis
MQNEKPRLLVISALFPPNVIGGAEISAFNIARGFLHAGWEVGILSCASGREQVCADRFENNMRVWRLPVMRPYPTNGYLTAPKYLKPMWHLQDHIDPRNRWQARRVIETFRPSAINIHIIQGIGYNVIEDIAELDIPTTFYQHDMGLACIRMSMFKAAHNCRSHCLGCALSSKYKLALLRKVRRLNLVSPSAGNFARMSEVIDLRPFQQIVSLNPNKYPSARIERTDSIALRVLYAGRLHESKGIDVLVKAIARLATRGVLVELNVAGSGPYEAELRAFAAKYPFIKLHGFISQQALSDLMQSNDVIAVPSIWAENSPGVLIHGLIQGLAALGSNVGGIPELIDDGQNGYLLPPGDPKGWEKKLSLLAADRTLLARLQAVAITTAKRFAPEVLMEKIISDTKALVSQPRETNHHCMSSNESTK